MIGAIVFIAVAGGGLISGDSEAIIITFIVAVSIAGIFTFFSIPEIIAGWAILKWKSWGRIFGIVIAIFDLINIPIGTAFGVYALWVLMNEETEKLFAQHQKASLTVEQG
jgi:hypothetical protein